MQIVEPKYTDGVAFFCTDAQFVKLTKAVETFKKFAPEVKGYEHQYDVWKEAIRVVIVLNDRGYENGLYHDYGIWVVKHAQIMEQDHIELSSGMFHEAQHMVQYQNDDTVFTGENYEKNLDAMEEDAYRAQRAYLEWVGDSNDLVWLGKGFERKHWMAQDETGEDYNVLLVEHDTWEPIVKAHDAYLKRGAS